MKGGLGGLIKQAQVMKMRMEQAKARLALEETSAGAGEPEAGGCVRVTVTGRQQVRVLSFDAELAKDPALLEDLLLTALNRALDESRARAESELNALGGGASLPFGL